jgi:hypothetical protein
MIFEQRVTVSGRTLKRVKCEQCKCDYAYHLTRRGVAHARPNEGAMVLGGALFGIIGHLAAGALFAPDDEDRARAHEMATKGLHNSLDRECEPVACPDCGWYQAAMVNEARRRRHRWMIWIGSIVVALAVCGLFFVISANFGQRYGDGPDPNTLWKLGAVAAAGLVILALRWALIRRHDPNELWPRRAVPYPNEPTARRLSELTPAARAAKGVVTSTGSRSSPRGRSAASPTDDAEDVDWFIKRGGQQAGPFTWTQLREMARIGRLYGEDLVYAAEFAEWEPASSIPGLMGV